MSNEMQPDAAALGPTLSGRVKWFDTKKGFGFIVSPDGRDVFVHFTSIVGDGFRALKDGETVEYQLLAGDKGLHALAVRRSAKPAPSRAAFPAGAAVAIQTPATSSMPPAYMNRPKNPTESAG